MPLTPDGGVNIHYIDLDRVDFSPSERRIRHRYLERVVARDALRYVYYEDYDAGSLGDLFGYYASKLARFLRRLDRKFRGAFGPMRKLKRRRPKIEYDTAVECFKRIDYRRIDKYRVKVAIFVYYDDYMERLEAVFHDEARRLRLDLSALPHPEAYASATVRYFKTIEDLGYAKRTRPENYYKKSYQCEGYEQSERIKERYD